MSMPTLPSERAERSRGKETRIKEVRRGEELAQEEEARRASGSDLRGRTFGELGEELVDALAELGRRLEVERADRARVLLGLGKWHVAVLVEVALVTHDAQQHVRTDDLPQLLHPVLHLQAHKNILLITSSSGCSSSED